MENPNKMEAYELNVYDAEGHIIKTCTARPVDLEFGTVRALMELLKIESIDDTATLLRVVYDSWDELQIIMGQCFPDMEYNDWNHIKVKELIPIMVGVLRYSVGEILTIPKSEKN